MYSLFYSFDQCVSFYTHTTLFLLLRLCSTTESQGDTSSSSGLVRDCYGYPRILCFHMKHIFSISGKNCFGVFVGTALSL